MTAEMRDWVADRQRRETTRAAMQREEWEWITLPARLDRRCHVPGFGFQPRRVPGSLGDPDYMVVRILRWVRVEHEGRAPYQIVGQRNDQVLIDERIITGEDDSPTISHTWFEEYQRSFLGRCRALVERTGRVILGDDGRVPPRTGDRGIVGSGTYQAVLAPMAPDEYIALLDRAEG